MKKIMRLLVIMLLITAFLVGCGANNARQSSSSQENAQQVQPKEELPQSEVEIDNNHNSTVETTDKTATKEVKETATVPANEAASKNEPQKQTETKEAAVTKPKQQSEPVVTNVTQEKEKPKQTATSNQSNSPAANQKVEGETKPNTPANDVTITIRGDGETGAILKSTKVSIEEGDTVLDVLKKVTKQNRIQMEYRGSGATAYIEGIQNLYEFDKGPKSGWMYSVNGTFMKKGAGTTEVKPGDKIEWVYTLDLGKDLGATVNE